MKTKPMPGIALVLLLLAGTLGVRSVNAQTLTIRLNPSGWTYVSHTVDNGYFAHRAAATGTIPPYNYSQTRDYYYGNFDSVVVRNDSTSALVAADFPLDRICYLIGTNRYACDVGFNGSGNGVLSGDINLSAVAANGDLYIGGTFGLAGGYSHAARFSCYRFNDGWTGVNEVETLTDVFLNGEVLNMTWVTPYILEVYGNFDQVKGPDSQGAQITTVNATLGVVYWHGYYAEFDDGYWTN